MTLIYTFHVLTSDAEVCSNIVVEEVPNTAYDAPSAPARPRAVAQPVSGP